MALFKVLNKFISTDKIEFIVKYNFVGNFTTYLVTQQLRYVLHSYRSKLSYKYSLAINMFSATSRADIKLKFLEPILLGSSNKNAETISLVIHFF